VQKAICAKRGDDKIFVLLISIGKLVEKLTGSSTFPISTHGFESYPSIGSVLHTAVYGVHSELMISVDMHTTNFSCKGNSA
jgi:hypothetical protein